MLSHSYESIPDAPESGRKIARVALVAFTAAFVVAGAVAGSLARPADAMLDSKLRGGDAAAIIAELTTYTPSGTPSLKPTSGCAWHYVCTATPTGVPLPAQAVT